MPRKRTITNSDAYNKPFPKNLRTLMDRNKITQQELADALGVQRQTISYYWDGSSSPNWEGIANIAKFFSVSADWLLGLTDVPSPDANMRSACAFTGLSETAVQNIQRETSQASTRLALEVILCSGSDKLDSMCKAVYKAVEGYFTCPAPLFWENANLETQQEVRDLLTNWDVVLLDSKEAIQYNKILAGSILSDIVENSKETAASIYEQIFGHQIEIGKDYGND